MNIDQLLKLIANALKISPTKINTASQQVEIEEWDSLGHLNILVQLDKQTDGRASLIFDLVEAKSIDDFIRILTENNLLKPT